MLRSGYLRGLDLLKLAFACASLAYTKCSVPTSVTADELVQSLRAHIDACVAEAGSTVAVNPGHRHPFHWPPHPVSPSYHVLSSDWKRKATFEAYGETFDVTVATTAYGVFGRCDALWHEAKGDSLESMLENLKNAAEPLFKRQMCIARCLHQTGRFTGHIPDLSLADLLKLLYCPDRDVANDARIEIDSHASLGVFAPALIEVLKDTRHPYRRSAQWCVLDLFEDLTSFCHTPQEVSGAVRAIRDLIWNSEDDYARTTFKAGVAVGGHMPGKIGGAVLLECLQAPSRIGRRAAIHGLFHVVEWDPGQRTRVVEALRAVAENDPEDKLRDYAAHMAEDIERSRIDHMTEPLFEDESQ